MINFFQYETTIDCNNCGHNSPIKIKKGVSIEEWKRLGKAKCKNCGCVIHEAEDQWVEEVEEKHKRGRPKTKRGATLEWN